MHCSHGCCHAARTHPSHGMGGCVSSLTAAEKQYLETVLAMGGGFVLEFSNDTFAEFFSGYGVDIYSGNYEKYGPSKAKRMRAFWEREPDSLVGPVLAGLLDLYEVQCALGRREQDSALFAKSRQIVSRIAGGTAESPFAGEVGFLNEEFAIPNLDRLPVDSVVAEIIRDRLEEAQSCLRIGAHLSVIFQCGSVLEGVLLGAAHRDPRHFNQAASSPKQPDGKVKQFHDWTLSELINTAHEIGLLKADVQKFSHGLRDFRNYIHPYQQMVSRFSPDEHTATVCFQVLKAALADISGAR